jgi:hypothetical protein
MASSPSSREFASKGLEDPIRAELFGIERLEQHAESLAQAQPVLGESGKGRSLLPRVLDNGRVLREGYREIAKAIQEERWITPAAEWLVENSTSWTSSSARSAPTCPGLLPRAAQAGRRPLGRIPPRLRYRLGFCRAHG